MDTPAALPPHTADPVGFDVDADVQALKATPKQDYSKEWEKIPDPPPANPTPGADPGKGKDAPPPPPESHASAREFILAYDVIQSYSFAMYSDGMKPEAFELSEYAKERASFHLAKGLEKMGKPELPWWVGLTLALIFPAFINFTAAKASRKRKAENAAKERNQAKAKAGFADFTITKPDGSAVPYTAPKQPGPSPAETRTPRKPRDLSMMPICSECPKHVRSMKRKTCGQSCSGKRTARLKREKNNVQ